MSQYFLIARIESAEGEWGELKINFFSDDPERFKKLKNVFIDFWGEKKIFTIQSVRRKKKNIFLKFQGFGDKLSAEVLVGKEIFVDEKNLIRLPKDHFFVHDMIGSKVLRNGVEFGTVVDVYKLPANDVYVINKIDGNEILIPAIHEFIVSFDAEKKVLTLVPGDDFYEEENAD